MYSEQITFQLTETSGYSVRWKKHNLNVPVDKFLSYTGLSNKAYAGLTTVSQEQLEALGFNQWV
ncbi:hypothetical protein [Paenibacillus terrigena]|uniref:hypothetical protein n=1 Tax=Paenibacillus terrigena TaxID=369333 RepID=UPI0003692568|nr:hypothetical protein [Paenibacillus terrigena]